jgi:hypothetical protein
MPLHQDPLWGCILAVYDGAVRKRRPPHSQRRVPLRYRGSVRDVEMRCPEIHPRSQKRSMVCAPARHAPPCHMVDQHSVH